MPWIESKIEDFKKHPISEFSLMLRKRSRRDYIANKRKALQELKARLEYFNGHYGLAYNRVTIRDQKSRWGSCSEENNLAFSFRLIMAPPAVIDYVIIHELMHIKEKNHSAGFWKLMETAMPQYKTQRCWLRENGHKFGI
jgi:hypothetical protein